MTVLSGARVEAPNQKSQG